MHSIALRPERFGLTVDLDGFPGLHMIDYAWDSQNKSIFHRQSQYDGDMTCVCSEQATFRTRVFGFPFNDPLARVVPIYRPLLSGPLL
ncbi:hypothetical protein TNCV_2081791 [Trichonephila clavipes]|nr:hypothetical protein TNCV_2081791 [Trichonephila clavipes]